MGTKNLDTGKRLFEKLLRGPRVAKDLRAEVTEETQRTSFNVIANYHSKNGRIAHQRVGKSMFYLLTDEGRKYASEHYELTAPRGRPTTIEHFMAVAAKEAPVPSDEPKRGRGRPRKVVVASEQPEQPKRGRGRPRKVVSPDQPVQPKRPRGRPRKVAAPDQAQVTVAKRGRGRPKGSLNKAKVA